MTDAGPCWTALADGNPIACAGFQECWAGRAIAWAILAETAGRHMPALTRAVKRALASHPAERIEAQALVGFAPATRWARLLGFVPETVLRRFHQGRDYQAFVLIKDRLLDAASAEQTDCEKPKRTNAEQRNHSGIEGFRSHQNPQQGDEKRRNQQGKHKPHPADIFPPSPTDLHINVFSFEGAARRPSIVHEPVDRQRRGIGEDDVEQHDEPKERAVEIEGGEQVDGDRHQRNQNQHPIAARYEKADQEAGGEGQDVIHPYDLEKYSTLTSNQSLGPEARAGKTGMSAPREGVRA